MNELERFIDAQDKNYDVALKEIRSGKKRSHWIWYIFPQISGLGNSSISQYYSIKDLQEAKAYMANEYLNRNLLEISSALLLLESNDINSIMGSPDDLKLRSCMTLFSIASPSEKVFQQVLDKYYNGIPDKYTINIIQGLENANESCYS